MNIRFALLSGLSLVVLSSSLLLAPSSQSAPPQNAPTTPASGKGGERLLVDQIDGLIQPRFADDAGGVFGLDRLYSTVQGHERVLPLSSGIVPELYDRGTESTTLKEIKASKYRYVIGFLHTTHTPGKPVIPQSMKEYFQKHPVTLSPQSVFLSPLATYDYLAFPVRATLSREKVYLDMEDSTGKQERQILRLLPKTTRIVRGWEKAAIAKLPQLNAGQETQIQKGDWNLYLRPVKATKASCVSCHSGAKVGDTLGVMLYAIAGHTEKRLQ